MSFRERSHQDISLKIAFGSSHQLRANCSDHSIPELPRFLQTPAGTSSSFNKATSVRAAAPLFIENSPRSYLIRGNEIVIETLPSPLPAVRSHGNGYVAKWNPPRLAGASTVCRRMKGKGRAEEANKWSSSDSLEQKGS